ncbi:hypothetical protein HFO56_23980 [Rhizobium laguerreae]|uniref:hypothetical protein n=1 Tax=Rhizobium laguerreae TaxID=1076926 RepID=UPI001C9069A0|nr:hypothetical protein [Rhizobium laguerreae]MBY3155388.1 hypothetical protein [Rhizobium laguerreae]
MSHELNRRSLFRGLLAASALRFLPAVPTTASVAPLVAKTLSPFADSSINLAEMLLELLADAQKVETIGIIRSAPSFQIGILDDIGPGEHVSETLTRHLGHGEWSNWDYSADDVREALSSLDREDEIRYRAIRHFHDCNQVKTTTIEVTPDVLDEVDLSVAA